MIHTEIITLNSLKRSHWIDITAEVSAVLRRSAIVHGILTVTSLHSTAAITINENGDPDAERDFFRKLDEMIPHTESYYRHAEGNSDSHVKTSLIGTEVVRSIVNGKIVLGTWQSIYFCEFDGPRTQRRCTVTVMGEPD